MFAVCLLKKVPYFGQQIIVSSYFRPVGIPTGTLFRVYYKILDFAMQPTILAWAATCVQVS